MSLAGYSPWGYKESDTSEACTQYVNFIFRALLSEQQNWLKSTGVSHRRPDLTCSNPINIPTRQVHLLQSLICTDPFPFPESIVYNRAHSWCHTFCVCVPSWVQLFATLWTAAHQALLSMEFFRQEYWSGFPFPFSRGSSRPRD